jgi:hypothetical protein
MKKSELEQLIESVIKRVLTEKHAVIPFKIGNIVDVIADDDTTKRAKIVQIDKEGHALVVDFGRAWAVDRWIGAYSSNKGHSVIDMDRVIDFIPLSTLTKTEKYQFDIK